MARLRGHPSLNADLPVFVLRGSVDQPVVCGGKSFVKGDAFPWRDLGIPFRKLHQMWLQRRIGHQRPDSKLGAESPTELVRPPDAARSKVEVEAPKAKTKRRG